MKEHKARPFPAAMLAAVLISAVVLAACSGPGFWGSPGGRGNGSEPAETTGEILAAAPASLTDVLNETAALFKEREPGADVIFVFGASGSLGSQISAGAPVDLFISAAREPMDELAEGGFTAGGGAEVLAFNTLVLAAHPDAAGAAGDGADGIPREGWDALKDRGVTRVAMGNPLHVPAGAYARQTLEHLGLWESVAPKAVYGEDVRQVMNFIETGNAQMGIVYETDALQAAPGAVEIVARAPAGSHRPIVYVMDVIKGGPNPRAAAAFMGFLGTDEVGRILERHGFAVP